MNATTRKDMTPSELVALGRALEELERPRARERQEAELKQNRADRAHPHTSTAPTHDRSGYTDKIVGEALGLGEATYTRAKRVVEAAEDESLPPEVRQVAREAKAEMDATGMPPLFTAREFDGTLTEYVDSLYWQYRAMLDYAGIRPWGVRLSVRSRETADGRGSRFWHLLTNGTSEHTTRTRRLSLTRCANLPRVWHVLELLAAGDRRVTWWRQRRQVFVAPADFSILVVLEVDGVNLYLATAYSLKRAKARRYYASRAAAALADGPCESPGGDGRHPRWAAYRRGTRPPARQLVTLGTRT